MNERLTKIKTTPVNFGQVEVKAKIVMIGSVVVVIALAAIVTFLLPKLHMFHFIKIYQHGKLDK